MEAVEVFAPFSQHVRHEDLPGSRKKVSYQNIAGYDMVRVVVRPMEDTLPRTSHMPRNRCHYAGTSGFALQSYLIAILAPATL
jgi:hypothetical protein